MRTHTLTIVVAASIASAPDHAGWTWAVLQYLLGFRRLGHRVHLIDPIAGAALTPTGSALHESTNAAYFSRVVERFALTNDASLLLADAEHTTIGRSYESLADLCGACDLLINVSGKLRDTALLSRAQRSLYLDVDPAFTQLWHAVEGIDMGFEGHTHFATVGQTMTSSSSAVPSVGYHWLPTLPPVVLEEWPVATDITWSGLTTVANWRGYGSIRHNDVLFGQKVHALRPLICLPRKTRERFLLALSIDRGETRDLEALADNGWELLDPQEVASTPAAYHAFVRGSKAEFAVAKSGYVHARCGWLSDRSVCYLASGRPVIAHDTGFGEVLPTGEGLFRFTTEDDVLTSIDAMNSDYPRHARAARALAEEYFDSDRVLQQLLDSVGA